MYKLHAAILLAALFQFTGILQTQAQTDSGKKQQVVRFMVDAYNRQDYRALKQPWIGLGKLIVTQKMLRKELEPFYKRCGRATIDTITHSKYSYIAKLQMEKAPAERIYLQCVFNDAAKLEGFGFAYPPMIYRRSASHRPIDAGRFSKAVDTLIAARYRGDSVSRFNGSVMVLDKGIPIYKRHYGYADFNRKTPLNDSTLFELASCSKQFTATAILLLAQEGKLSLDDSVQRFIPALPYHGITIRQLLTHTSGLPGYEDLLKKHWDRSRFAANNDVIAMLAKHKPKAEFEPGARFSYSNTGYALLSSIIERSAGMSYADFLKTKIFEPLGMRRTRVYNTRRSGSEVLNNYAYGYVMDPATKTYRLPDSVAKYSYVVYLDAITGDGTVNSCLSDLALWETELLQHRLISEDLFRQAISRQQTSSGKPVDYGYGFFLRGGGGAEPLVFHTGGWPGYATILMNFFDQQQQIVILSNNGYDNFTRMADDIAGMMLEQEW